MTLADAVAEFEAQLHADGRSPHTIGSYLRALRLLADHLGADTDVASITPGQLARFITSDRVALTREGERKTPGSVNQVKSALRAFFRHLVVTDVLVRSPTRALRSARTSSPVPQVLTADEGERLLAVIDDTPLGRRDRVLFALLLGTGVRVSAAVGLDVADVRLDQRRLVVTGKGGARDAVVLTTRLVVLLREHLDGLDDGPVFRSRGGDRLSARQVQFRLRRWLDAAGIEKHVTVHGLRHSYGTRLYAACRDLRLVQQALHHRRVTTTEIYAHLGDGRLAAVVEGM